MSERVRLIPGSTGCQPAIVGSLPTILSTIDVCSRHFHGSSFRLAAEHGRVAACAPQHMSI
jgi:hypothetical protein